MFIEIAQQTKARGNQKQFNYSKLTNEIFPSGNEGHSVRLADVTEKESGESTSEGVLIDLVAPGETKSLLIPVASTGEHGRSNSLLDEPIDAVEEGIICLRSNNMKN